MLVTTTITVIKGLKGPVHVVISGSVQVISGFPAF